MVSTRCKITLTITSWITLILMVEQFFACMGQMLHKMTSSLRADEKEKIVANGAAYDQLKVRAKNIHRPNLSVSK